MKNALLFPGQGAQRPGMLKALQRHPEVESLLSDLKEVLALTAEDLHSVAALRKASNIQLALFVAGVASFRILTSYRAPIDCVSGFSIGAFSAAVASGAFTFRDLLPVVALRGEAMEQAFPTGYGMLAVAGPRPQALIHWICSEPSLKEHVYLSNVNSSTQVVFAGRLDELDIVARHARGVGFSRVQLLDVPTPSHCPLLSGVSLELKKAFAAIASQPPICLYLSNTATRLIQDEKGIRDDLITNVAHPINWRDGIELQMETGVTCFVESLPSDILTRLGKEDDRNGRASWISVAEKGFAAAANQLAIGNAARA